MHLALYENLPTLNEAFSNAKERERYTTPTPDADIGIAFPVSPITAQVDEVFEYRGEIKNSGNVTAANVFAEISLANGITTQSSSVNGGRRTNNNGGGVDCDMNNLGAGATKTVRLKLLANRRG